MTSTTNVDTNGDTNNNDPPPPILVKYSHMRREWDRLCSFTSDFQTVNQINCPHIRPDSLARSGFFYSGISDGCTCFVCGVTLSKWEPSDTPEGEHEKHVPNCPFLLNGGQLCGNLPLPAKNGSTASSSSSSSSSNTTTTLKNDENHNESSRNNSKNNDTTNSASYNGLSARDLFGDDEEEMDDHEDEGFGLFGDDDDDYVPTKKSSASATAPFTTKNEEEEEKEKTKEEKNGKEAAAAETKKEVIKDARVKQMFISDLLFSLLQAEMNEHLGVDSSKSPVMTPTTADSNVSFSQSIFDT